MDYKKIYEEWLENPYFDDETKKELKAISQDENEIKELKRIKKNSFYWYKSVIETNGKEL